MRKGFNFYRSYWEVANELNDKDRLAFYDALLKKQFTNVDSELNGMVKFAYLSQKHSIDKQIDGYVNKTIQLYPNQDPWQGGSEGALVDPWQQEKEKEKVQAKEKKLNIEERKSKFYDSLTVYVDEYPKKMLRDFYDYWSEHGEKDKKLRFEKEKTFGIEQRLRTWYNRNPKQYDQDNDPNPPEYYLAKKQGLC